MAVTTTCAVEGHEFRGEAVSLGRPATEALWRRVREARAGHPLDPVTVVVPSNTAGLSVRRLLGSGGLGGAGLANVTFVTPFRLAEVLGSAALGPRRPLTNPVLAAAARAVLASEPGIFAPVAGHRATQAAVVRTYGELSRALPATLAAIAARSERGAAVVRVLRAVASRLSGHHDEDDLAAAATARLLADPQVAASLGTVVWHLPERLSPAMRHLVGTVLRCTPSSVVVGLTGVDEADAAVRQVCSEVGVAIDPAAAVAVPHADRIVSVADPDEEVRTVVRELMALAAAGTPLDRIAIVFPTPEPYARTLLEQLRGAGIPHNGPATARLADSVVGRTLLAALALPALGWRRSDVVALVAGAPVRHRRRSVASDRWDALSRAAGVVGGLADWERKLSAHAETLGAGDRATVEDLLSFVDGLASALEVLHGSTSWRDRSAAARSLLDGLLGPEHLRGTWPDDEADAARRVDTALARLVVLDEVEPDPSAAAFELAVAAELEAPTGRVGRFGEGVLVAPLAAAAGLDLDAVFVLGMAEGTCPSFRRDESLLPDDDRTLAVGGELLTRQQRLADEHRSLLAALASASRHRTLLFPRGDLRDGRRRLASRWLLDSASHHAGRRLFSSDVADLGPPVVETVPSFAAGVSTAAVHGSLTDRDVATLLDHVAAGGDPARHPLATGELGRGLRCQRARGGSSFTEWDGNVGGLVVPSPTSGVPVSASRLETWASCPFAYFLGHVLHLAARDDPEEVVELDPSARGTLVHEVLERFFAEAIDRPEGSPASRTAWSGGDRARIAVIAEDAFARCEAAGLTGRPLLWRRTQADVLADLGHFLESDDAHRASGGVRPVSVEMAFGSGGHPPLGLDLPDGRTITFRGRADRVDAGADGSLVVLDYKTGVDRYRALEDDPVRAGTTLQLGVYAEAARARHGGPAVDARYWMVSSRGGFAQRGYRWTDDHRRRLLEVVGVIVDGIESGVFPARPGAFDAFFATHENCRHCEFDRVCPRNRDDHEQAKAGAPELDLLARLRPPTAEGEGP